MWLTPNRKYYDEIYGGLRDLPMFRGMTPYDVAMSRLAYPSREVKIVPADPQALEAARMTGLRQGLLTENIGVFHRNQPEAPIVTATSLKELNKMPEFQTILVEEKKHLMMHAQQDIGGGKASGELANLKTKYDEVGSAGGENAAIELLDEYDKTHWHPYTQELLKAVKVKKYEKSKKAAPGFERYDAVLEKVAQRSAHPKGKLRDDLAVLVNKDTPLYVSDNLTIFDRSAYGKLQKAKRSPETMIRDFGTLRIPPELRKVEAFLATPKDIPRPQEVPGLQPLIQPSIAEQINQSQGIKPPSDTEATAENMFESTKEPVEQPVAEPIEPTPDNTAKILKNADDIMDQYRDDMGAVLEKLHTMDGEYKKLKAKQTKTAEDTTRILEINDAYDLEKANLQTTHNSMIEKIQAITQRLTDMITEHQRDKKKATTGEDKKAHAEKIEGIQDVKNKINDYMDAADKAFKEASKKK